jgi:hypothetical protein
MIFQEKNFKSKEFEPEKEEFFEKIKKIEEIIKKGIEEYKETLEKEKSIRTAEKKVKKYKEEALEIIKKIPVEEWQKKYFISKPVKKGSSGVSILGKLSGCGKTLEEIASVIEGERILEKEGFKEPHLKEIYSVGEPCKVSIDSKDFYLGEGNIRQEICLIALGKGDIVIDNEIPCPECHGYIVGWVENFQVPWRTCLRCGVVW